MEILVHLVAKPGKRDALVHELQDLGFEHVRCIPEERVLLSADVKDLQEALGLEFAFEDRERRVGPLTVSTRAPALAQDAKLPKAITELVDRFYVPSPPDRLR